VFAGRFSSSTGAIGIDFGSRGIKMVQLREKAGALQVIGAARLDVTLAQVSTKTVPASEPASIPAPVSASDANAADTLSQQLRAALLAGNFSGTRCIVSLAREDVSLQSIRLPKMPDDELRQTAMWEASQRFGFDRNATEVEFLRTGATLQSGENREEVILIAASHAAIHARVEPVLAAGLRPIAVDTGFSALVRAFSRQYRREVDLGQVRAIVEVGESGSTVLILRGNQIAFCKPIAIGGRNFNQAVADHLRISLQQAAELREARIAAAAVKATADPSTDRAVYEAVRPLMGDLVKEVTLCLRYYGVTFRGHPPDHIIITGGDGLEPRLGEVMAHTCKTPVLFDDSTGMLASLIPQIHNSLNRTPGPAAAWAVALGLSIRGIGRRSGILSHHQKTEAGSAAPRPPAAAPAAIGSTASSTDPRRSAA